MKKIILTTLCLVGCSAATTPPAAAQSCTVRSQAMNITFDTQADAKPWGAVNDGVMGGRSSGGPSFADGVMVFNGVINTNGGGFSSIRRLVEPGQLSGAEGMKLRVKSDGRQYKLSLRTDAYFRRRSVAFQAPIPTTKIGEWETVFVPFSALQPSIFGRPLRGANFDASKVNTLGIIIADGKDGPFTLLIDGMQSCKAGAA